MIIGVGYRAESGKDTVANYLCKYHGFVRFGFADPLKESLKPIFRLTDEHLYGSLKGEVLPFWSEKFGHEVTPRWIMQYYGTEVMRNWQQQIWVWASEQFVRVCQEKGQSIVFSDTRFFNEAHSVKSWDGKVFEIVRPSLPKENIGISGHLSETAMSTYDDWDGQIMNDGTVEPGRHPRRWQFELYRNAEQAIGLPSKAAQWVANGRPPIPAASSMIRQFMIDQYTGAQNV